LNQFDRTLLLSHSLFHKKNLEDTIKVLINNGYPLSGPSFRPLIIV